MTDLITTEEKKPTRRSRWAGLGVLLCLLGILIFIGAFTYGYVELSKVNVALVRMVSDLRIKLDQTNTETTALQQAVTQLQQQAQQAQTLTAQQAELVASWQAAQKGDLEKWYIAEADYLVKLANDHLQFSHDTTMALILLQRAEQVLQKAQDSRALLLRKAIAEDIVRLQGIPTVDITALYLRLNAINTVIDQLPLRETIKPNETKTTAIPSTTTLPWWKVGLEQSWQALQKMIVVRDTRTNVLPLILPEEKIFLYQNLHAQCEEAMWGVLHHNAVVFQAAIERMRQWIEQYFDLQAPAVQNVLQFLRTFQNVNIQPASVHLDTTLQQFDQYLSAQTTTPSPK